ncbi:hypothetical protein NDA07_27010 [Microcoleus vaginatus DQ-U2]|nr:hypothetical protein [Microcoleus sp. FACHB-DQ6]
MPVIADESDRTKPKSQANPTLRMRSPLTYQILPDRAIALENPTIP